MGQERVDARSATTALVGSAAPLALLPVQVTELASPRRGEPVTVYSRTGHIVNVGRGFDEEAFARVVVPKAAP